MIALLTGLAGVGAMALALLAMQRGRDPATRLGCLLFAAALILVALRLPVGAVLAALGGSGLLALGARRTRRRLRRRRSPWHRHGRSGRGGDAGSTVRTGRIEVTLDHASGRMSGRVLSGPHAGVRLEALGLDALLELAAAVPSDDTRTLTLLTTYLDRMHPGWSDTAEAEAPVDAATMTRVQALGVLGLSDGATREEIVAAHRRLIKRVHPDVGGSSALTAQINAAKSCLLGAEGLS